MRHTRAWTVWIAAGCLALLCACGGPQRPAAKARPGETPLPSIADTYKAMREAMRTNGATPTTGGIYTYLHGVDDHARVAFVSTLQGQTQVCTILPDGTDFKALTDTEGYKCRPVWSMDHKMLAFFHYAAGHSTEDLVDVVVMDADGGHPRTVIAQRHVDTKKTRICWKADNSVLYVQEKDFPSLLFGYAVASGQQVDTVRIPKTSFIKEVQTLSPDSEMVSGVGPEPKTGFPHVGAVRLANGEDLDFMKYFQQKSAFELGTVVWSYDSSLVAFELDSAVIIMSTAFKALVKFHFYAVSPMELNCEYTSPAFSPQGQYIVCVMEKGKEGNVGSGDREVKSDLWIVGIDGTKPHPLTTTGANFDPSW